MLFSNKSTYPIGIDISDSSLKLVQLNRVAGKIKVQAVGKKDLKEGLFKDGEITMHDEVVKAIKELVEKPQFGFVSGEEVVACLPETKTFIKMVRIEKSPNDIVNLIEAELEKHIPLEVGDMYYDWQIVKTTREHHHILIGASPKNIVDQYNRLFSDAGLQIVAFEVEPVATARGLLIEENIKYRGNFDKNYFIIDIGAARTNITAYAKNSILFSLSIPLSGNEITSEISKALEIDQTQAEKAKIICGLDEGKAQGVVKNILSEKMGGLIKKIKDATIFFSEQTKEKQSIDKIIVCGGGANIKNLEKTIEEKTSIPTIIGDPTVNLPEAKKFFLDIINQAFSPEGESKEKNQENLIPQDTPATFSTSIGLALRNIFLEE